MEIADPTRIGRYQVLRRLGAGAMGAVYLCQDPLLKRKVAVKIVQNKGADSELMGLRFQRESEISAQLNHPNIITIFDVGNDEVVGPFLTMEFVDGASLAALLEMSAPDPATSIQWLSQLGQALVTAENAGVIHRDIKPENILIGKDGRLKLSDFGLARNEEGRLTTTGMLMGTPAYTAPELLAGHQASFATDRWALAVTAFQIVTGNQLPYKATSISSLLHHIANEPPTIPEGMSASMKRVFLKALHREPARRYDSVLAFLEALAQAMGIPEQLDRRGLSLEPVAAATPPGDGGETQTLVVAQAHRPEPKPPVPKEGQTTPVPLPATPKLTGPPKDLLKGGSDADIPETHFGNSPQVRSHTATLPKKVEGSRPSESFLESSSNVLKAGLVIAFLGLLGIYYFFFHPFAVHFDSTPIGATVFVDNINRGATPLDCSVNFGQHYVRVELPGYDPETKTFTASESPLSFRLKAYMSFGSIKTEPPGAEVYFGGRRVGITPFDFRVPETPTMVSIRLPGYRTWERPVAPGRPLPEVIKLERE